MIYDKNEDSDPNNCPEMQERHEIINQLMEKLDGVCIVGFNRKTGEPFASSSFLDPACGDALSFFHEPMMNWMGEQSNKLEKNPGPKRV